MAVILYAVIILGGAAILLPFWAEAAKKLGLVRLNYRGLPTVQSMGVVFIALFPAAGLWARTSGLIPAGLLSRFVIVVIGFGLLGLLDDILGDGKSKGFGGHLRRLFSGGGFSTGLLKAVLGFIVSFWAVSGLPGFFPTALWRAALVALSANFLNLLDLRPGRSLKGFFLLAALVIWQIPQEAVVLLLLPFLLTALVYFPRDLAGEGMLGDTGANSLGGIAGLAAAYGGGAGFQIVLMALLIFIHILAEKKSLTKIIAGNYFLRYIDHLGRTRL